ncbi:hypothetical protein, partial [Thalassospira sp. TSL5-1]|uniref:hypothetical protein n=1 Tax=Thalassospira sp. TSL5-1 TaxID=1544451 RepID=UPI000AC5D9C9
MFGLLLVGMWMFVAYEVNDAINITSQSFYERGGSKLTGWEQKTKFLGYFGYGYVWGENLYWETTYKRNCLKYEVGDCTKDTTPVQFWMIKIKSDFSGFIEVLLVYSGILFLLTYYIFMRKPRCVVFNQTLGAIYTWHRGNLWILPASEFSYRYREEVNYMVGRVGNGFMQMSLRLAKKPEKTKKFKMGVFPYPCDKYGVRLAETLEIYLHRKDGDTSYIPQASTYRWWERSLLGRKKLPKDIHDQAE